MSEELYTYLNTVISDSVSTGEEGGGTRSRPPLCPNVFIQLIGYILLVVI